MVFNVSSYNLADVSSGESTVLKIYSKYETCLGHLMPTTVCVPITCENAFNFSQEGSGYM